MPTIQLSPVESRLVLLSLESLVRAFRRAEVVNQQAIDRIEQDFYDSDNNRWRLTLDFIPAVVSQETSTE
jgi:hypothetical protein